VEWLHFKFDNYPQWAFLQLPVKHLDVVIMGANWTRCGADLSSCHFLCSVY